MSWCNLQRGIPLAWHFHVSVASSIVGKPLISVSFLPTGTFVSDSHSRPVVYHTVAFHLTLIHASNPRPRSFPTSVTPLTYEQRNSFRELICCGAVAVPGFTTSGYFFSPCPLVPCRNPKLWVRSLVGKIVGFWEYIPWIRTTYSLIP